MIDSSKLKDVWGWDTTSSPGVVKKKTGGGGNSTTTAGKTSITEPIEETTYTLPTNNSPLGTTGGETVANNDFKYPSEWDQASDLWGNMASGNYSNAGTDWLKNLMSSGGSPVDVSGIWNSMLPTIQRTYEEGGKNIDEGWYGRNQGVAGGTGKDYQKGDLWSRLMENAGLSMAQQGITAQENAMSRATGAGGTLANLLASIQGQGGQGLTEQGNLRSQLPLQVGSFMSGAGNQLNSQDAMWAQLLGQLTGNNYAQPQTYTKSGFQNVLGSLSQTLPSALSSWDDKGWWS